jgi:hypothetical protein
MSEGPNRRRIRNPTIDAELAHLFDNEIDARNARIWKSVSAECARSTGVLADLSILGTAGEGRRLAAAHAAACVICLTRFGVPVLRLEEITGSNRASFHRWKKSPSDEIARIVALWESGLGPVRASRQDLTAIVVTKEAAQLLERAACLSGESATAIASAAILAAAQSVTGEC